MRRRVTLAASSGKRSPRTLAIVFVALVAGEGVFHHPARDPADSDAPLSGFSRYCRDL
jgi:hypothetical protein